MAASRSPRLITPSGVDCNQPACVRPARLELEVVEAAASEAAAEIVRGRGWLGPDGVAHRVAATDKSIASARDDMRTGFCFIGFWPSSMVPAARGQNLPLLRGRS